MEEYWKNEIITSQYVQNYLLILLDLNCFFTISPGVSFSRSVGGVNTFMLIEVIKERKKLAIKFPYLA